MIVPLPARIRLPRRSPRLLQKIHKIVPPRKKENQPISNVESTGNNPAEDSNVQEIKDSSTTTETIANESEKTDEYYRLIKQAWQEQSEYINSLTDSKVKQSVQTPSAAANTKASQLELDNPADTQLIQTSLKQVLNGQ